MKVNFEQIKEQTSSKTMLQTKYEKILGLYTQLKEKFNDLKIENAENQVRKEEIVIKIVSEFNLTGQNFETRYDEGPNVQQNQDDIISTAFIYCFKKIKKESQIEGGLCKWIRDIKNKCISLEKQLDLLKSNQNNQLKSFEQQNQMLKSKLQEVLKDFEGLKSKNCELSQELFQKNNQRQSLQQQNQMLQYKLQAVFQDFETLKSKNHELQQELFMKNQVPLDSMRLFIGDTIQEQPHRQYLLKELQKIMPGRKIKKTKLLYMFPLMQKTSFHDCVDNHPYFVILIRLATQHVVAFFSSLALSKDNGDNTSIGFLASLTNEKTYYLKKDKQNSKLFKYDPYYMKIGNQDLRLELQDPKGTTVCRFATVYGHFDAKDSKNAFNLIGSQRQGQAVSYEVFKLILDEQL